MASAADKNEPPLLESFLSWPVVHLATKVPLPGAVFLCISHRMVRYKNAGDDLSTEEFDKLIYNRVRYLFINEADKAAFAEWSKVNEKKEAEEAHPALEPDQVSVVESTEDLRRTALDLFANPTGDDPSKAAINMAKKMVTEFLKKPYVVNNVTALQRYGKGVVDHSVNVSVLSVFLGLRMGYSSQVILEHLAVGGLMHDIGKSLMGQGSEKIVDADDAAYEQHPQLGKSALEANKQILEDVSNEARMIVVQHHEYLDGSGFPSKLRGLAIYDLARLVSIANVFDNLVSESDAPTVKERMEDALETLERDYQAKLDPKKLEKAIKVIKTGLG